MGSFVKVSWKSYFFISRKKKCLYSIIFLKGVSVPEDAPLLTRAPLPSHGGQKKKYKRTKKWNKGRENKIRDSITPLRKMGTWNRKILQSFFSLPFFSFFLEKNYYFCFSEVMGVMISLALTKENKKKYWSKKWNGFLDLIKRLLSSLLFYSPFFFFFLLLEIKEMCYSNYELLDLSRFTSNILFFLCRFFP